MLGESDAKGSFELSGVLATQEEVVCAQYFVNYLHSSVNHLLLWWAQCSPLLGPLQVLTQWENDQQLTDLVLAILFFTTVES